MGWICYDSKELYSNGKVNRRKEMDKVCSWETDDHSSRVLKSVMVGSVYYAAVEVTTISTGAREVTAVVCITCGRKPGDPNGYNFGYKFMDETMGPLAFDCPGSILKLLTPTENEEAQTWRDICFLMNERKELLATHDKVRAMFSYDVVWKDGTRMTQGTVYEFQKIRVGKTRKNIRWFLIKNGKTSSVCIDNKGMRYADLVEACA